MKYTPRSKGGTFISYAVVQCLSLLYSFSKKSQNPGSVHYQFVQIFDEHLKCLIYLGYWRTKHWKYLVFEEDAERHKFGGNRVWKAEEVRKNFVNPKIEIEVFSYIICSLDFKNISCTLFLLHMKTMNGVVSSYILLLALHHLFHFIACVSFLSIFFFFLSFFVSSITCWSIEVSLAILKRKQWSCF